MQLREFAKPTLITSPHLETRFVFMDPTNALSLEGLPSIDKVAAPIREIREYYYRWLSQRCDTLSPQNMGIIRNEYLFDSMAVAIPYLFEYADGRILVRDGKIKPPKDFKIWVNICQKAVYPTTSDVIWRGVHPFISAKMIEDDPEVVYRPRPVKCPEGTVVKLEYCLLKKGEHYEFEPPTLFYSMAALNYSNQTSDELLQHLTDDHFLDKDILPRSLPVLPFIAEDLLLRRPEQLKDFITGLAKKIGGEEGFAIATAIMEDLIEIYQPLLTTRLTLFTDVIPAIPLAETMSELKIQYKSWRYKYRPEVISRITIEEGLAHPAEFYDSIFFREGVRNTMITIFGTSKHADIREVLEAALGPNLTKTMPRGEMPFGHMFGLSREESLILAAVNYMAWGGVIKPYDQIIDWELSRDEIETILAKEGLATALDLTMMTLADVLVETFHDVNLRNPFIQMLRTSCSANKISRRLDWNTPFETIMQNIMEFNRVFSWYPRYLGERTDLTEAGNYFAEFQENALCLVEINHDIDDSFPEEINEESGRDLGIKITPPMKKLMELPDDVVAKADKDEFVRVYESERQRKFSRIPPTVVDIDNIRSALQIGHRYREVVAQALYQDMHPYFKRAQEALKNGFARLAKLAGEDDWYNQRYEKIFYLSLKGLWVQFCKYGKINPSFT